MDELRAYTDRHRINISEVIREGIIWRLQQSAPLRMGAPRPATDDLAALSSPDYEDMPFDEDMAISLAPPAETTDTAYNDNMVISETAQSKAGRPRGAMRQRILVLLAEHPGGLSAEEIRAYLKPERPLGDTLQGMRRQNIVKTRGSGKDMKYFLA
jgi:hypothetical protein